MRKEAVPHHLVDHNKEPPKSDVHHRAEGWLLKEGTTKRLSNLMHKVEEMAQAPTIRSMICGRVLRVRRLVKGEGPEIVDGSGLFVRVQYHLGPDRGCKVKTDNEDVIPRFGKTTLHETELVLGDVGLGPRINVNTTRPHHPHHAPRSRLPPHHPTTH